MAAIARPSFPVTHHRTAKVDGVDVFYREAGPTDAPVVVPGDRARTSRELRARINRRLREVGYTVVAGDLADMLAKDDPSGDGIHPVEMDVRDQASIDAAVATAAGMGTLRGVVNCAGLVRFTPVATPDEDDMDTLWRVNVAGMARVMKAASPHLGDGSAVVNIASLTGLIGRADAVSDIVGQLNKHRFVTILGPGGIGKTSVALAVAEQVAISYDSAVCVVDCAPLLGASLVARKLASTLGLEIAVEDPTRGLVAFLRSKRMLIVLDCCERVVEDAAAGDPELSPSFVEHVLGRPLVNGHALAAETYVAPERPPLAPLLVAVIARYPEKASVTVHYHPANPSQATLETHVAHGWIGFAFVLASFAAALFFSGRL